MDDTTLLLKELTEANGVSGHEAEIRAVVEKRLAGLGAIEKDKIGSLICRKQGAAKNPTVMIAGHMDEIGFMIKLVTKEGFLKFVPLGGWFDQVLLGQRVTIMTAKGKVAGVIGAKPPHLLPPDEREKVVKKKDMYIDIGATSKEEVEQAGVRAGDPAVPQAQFTALAGGRTYLSKAFDDRVGVALMIQALEALKGESHPNTVCGAATVMEEVGLRGATTSVEAVHPDAAIVLESDIAGDVPGITEDQSAVKLGRGPTVMLFDARMIPNLRLRDLVMDTAQELSLPLQTSVMEGGATDGAAIHLHKTGVPTVVLGVPTRHIHSHSGILHRADYDAALQLLLAVLRKLDSAAVAALTA
ncbi:MAG: M42 family metallopeptidase [Anaerolineales bacterium]|nr:M42 family metallopeptidase [Anaerolineales bacterium]